MRKAGVILPKFEVTVSSNLCYEIKKVVDARNEYEATLKMADSLSGDFDFYFNQDDYEVISVTQTD